ncbi:3'-5' exonuclease [Pleurotus pulmonarius]|nr:3'-5' exonuclease [Pleurotus pulmonarius]
MGTMIGTAMSKIASTSRSSSNWLALKKTLPTKKSKDGKSKKAKSHKRQKTEDGSPPPEAGPSRITLDPPQSAPTDTASTTPGDLKSALKAMVLGDVPYSELQKQPGKYLALDCEMVGVGIDGSESSLARVSLVNYHGAVQLDEFVRQRERVVDYRTQYSGVRERDMVNAKPFEEIQTQVAELLKDKILVGHAVFNDLKALLLSHPRPQTLDTQYYAWKFQLTKSKYIALRNLVKQELGLTIQGGEHSSVTDARATMAIFRLYKREWEKNLRPVTALNKKKRKRDDDEEDEETINGDAVSTKSSPSKNQFPGGGKKGVSSGLSTVVRRQGEHAGAPAPKTTKQGWWKDLGGKLKR